MQVKVYMLEDRKIRDWKTGEAVGDFATFEGEVYIIGLGWFLTWIEGGEKAVRFLRE